MKDFIMKGLPNIWIGASLGIFTEYGILTPEWWYIIIPFILTQIISEDYKDPR